MKSDRVIESAIRAAQNLLWQNLPPTHNLPDAAAVGAITRFKEGLNELGYVEGKNVAVEYRWAQGENAVRSPSSPRSARRRRSPPRRQQ